MALEIEAKLRVDSHEAVRRALRNCDAKSLGRVLETNHILDAEDGRLRAAGAALRVRVAEPADGGPAAVTATYKGPKQPGRFKRRAEIETSATNADTLLELLAALGFREVVSFCKRRESYQVGPCRVELDDVPMLGRFVEIEGPDEDAIRQVQVSLGLADLDHVPRGYVSLLIEHCESIGRDPVHIDFDD